MPRAQTFVAAGTLVVAALLAAGATQISAEAGYAGIGPNFVPWVVAAALAVCGAWLLWESLTGGFRQMDADEAGDTPAAAACWPGFAAVSAGILLNAALITTIGFILSCTLCFVLATRGYKASQGQPDLRPATLAKDALVGLAISAPVYWLFTKLLAINLPGLTGTGWI
ncbi:tripartite tricarboxylate transporter TctB family protein [Aquincola sp. MAHUQ-54]|uniref:Tripartite tricarboxylate transporter TctB family protein n=1 Tax=Aquincola agrisoli TaxID=3119538 RepID=A0AAW9QIP1_9BURK